MLLDFSLKEPDVLKSVQMENTDKISKKLLEENVMNAMNHVKLVSIIENSVV